MRCLVAKRVASNAPSFDPLWDEVGIRKLGLHGDDERGVG